MKLSRLIEEFRRRRVFRVAAAFAVVAWIAVQVADIAFEAFEFPGWAMQLLIIVGSLSFLVVLALAWAFDVEPDGIRRTPPIAAPSEGDGVDRSPRDGVARFGPSRTGFLWLAAGGLVIALGGAGLLLRDADTGAADLAQTRIAVFPFSYSGSEDLAYLREGVVNLLSTKLNGAGDLTTVDPNALLRSLQDADAGSIEESNEIARRFGAGSFITGSILEAGGSIEIHALLHDARGAVENEQSVRTLEGELLEALDRIARSLLADRFGRESAQMERLAALTTSSTTALKSFLQGEAAFRHGEAEKSRAFFQAAVEEDSTFALAHYRLSVAGSWFPRSTADFEQVRESMRAAQRHADRLSLPTRQILSAYVAYQGGGDSAEAERLMRSLVRTHPDNAEAWYLLGEVLLHRASQRGLDPREARPAFERTIELDPQQTFSLLHLADLAAYDGDVAALASIHRRMEAVAPERAALAGYYELMLRDDEPAIRDSMEAAAAEMDPAFLTEVFWRGAATAHSSKGLEVLANQMAERGGDVERTYGLRATAGLAAARGRPSAMADQFREVGLLGDGGRTVQQAEGLDVLLSDASYLLALPFLPPRPAEIRAVRNTLPAARPGFPQATYLYGLLSLRLQEESAARQALARIKADSLAGSYFGTALEAHLAWGRDDVAGTIRTLEQEPSLQPMERYLFARALVAAGRSREAIDWLQSFPDYTTDAAVAIAFHPPAVFRRAVLLEEVGDVEGAKSHYAEFLEWWDGAEPELQDMVQEARTRLRRLVAR